MSRYLKIALVGRPNVGKSALFNRMVGRRMSIVDEAEGITRDRLYALCDVFGTTVQVIDTGGIHPDESIPFQEEIRRQAEIAIEEADTVIQVVDGTVGTTVLDEYVARLLLRTQKRVLLAVNKLDDFGKQDLLYPFYSLGIEKVFGISALQGLQIAELLEASIEGLSIPKEAAELDKRIRVAIVGRPNVGKSTLLNHLLSEDRCVVSPIAGTTRDSIDVDIEVDGQPFTLIDTAGIRRKNAEHEVVDKFAALRTEWAIERAEVCILMLDAEKGMTTDEKRIAQMIEEQGKGCILLFNKWDLVKGYRMEHCLSCLQTDASFLIHCPTLFASAKTGRNLEKLFSLIREVHTDLHQRISTGQLNRFLEKAVQKNHPPMLMGGKRLRIYYMAQVDISPPHFVVFVNNTSLMTDTYRKYLVNQFRESYRFSGVPLTFSLKTRRSAAPAQS